ncbi:hypothetical protein AAOE16_03025 [Ekhidna sp. MALMAid0563]|uniref:hypothetical protein n=1 Tax=Ekhidna sp. MALMAid0563 TaxID=3143937 RepID=UPI0032DE3BCA
MKKTIKLIAVAAISFAMIGCASQNKQKENNNQESTSQRGRQQGPPSYSLLLTDMDTNKDGKLAKSEIKGRLANDFSKIDSNSDGYITESEFKNAPRPQRGGRR